MNRSVLVVDDDEVHREAIQRLLHDTYEVVEAPTARFAENELQVRIPDCVLLDYRLPDGTGFQLLPQMRELGLPVVMMTSQGSEQIAVSAMKHGCHDYVVKNQLTAASLTHTIANAIEKATLRRRVEEQRRELEEFVRTAAHDFRAPLRTIASRCELLQHDSRDTADQLAHLRFISRAVTRLSRLIDALLRYTNLEQTEDHIGRVELDLIVHEVRAGLEAAIRESRAKIEVVSPLPVVRGDPVALAQLFQNLIENALKYRSSESPRVRITAAADGEQWVISVADNGRGLAPEDCERIFQPLTRQHLMDEEGSGIGLAICQRIVQRHGGRIWAESKLGAGTTFLFTVQGEQ